MIKKMTRGYSEEVMGRVTIMIDPRIQKKIQLQRAKMITESQLSISFSEVANLLMDTGLKSKDLKKTIQGYVDKRLKE